MNPIAQAICNRLSLRSPQARSLDILTECVDALSLSKEVDLQAELTKIHGLFPTLSEFEREFPSLCFALATGVGKTRLMGAFIVYLYRAKKIRNFFVLAPNLTIYNKLIEDFGNPAHPKYVFQGISEFATQRPRVITGDNYDQVTQTAWDVSDVTINVFNISKINAETRGGNEPRIKRMAECLGEPYFNYLAGLPDLVILMDESHHYRAERGMQVINDLKPILGLELTATPQVERSGGAIKFKNVVYEYSLAKAIQDGFVKEPAVATRKDFDPASFSPEELDRIKLEDGIHLHENTKGKLEIFARNMARPLVKPFILVVAKDTDHAAQLKALIESQGFFGGSYKGKVMEIHSAQKGSEKDENVDKLLSLERLDNPIEIVIHVNMLKEGWDVTNLYTIVPLRTAASQTLREQTIGRGLRLPYGMRIGIKEYSAVDKLTIVAHDKFDEIIREANLPNSIIKRENIIEIDPTEFTAPKEVIAAPSKVQQAIQEERKAIEALPEPQRHEATLQVESKAVLAQVIPQIAREIQGAADLAKPEVKEMVLRSVQAHYEAHPNLFQNEHIEAAKKIYESFVESYVASIIEIPRLVIQASAEVKWGFHDFELDTRSLTSLQPMSKEILVRVLRENNDEIILGNGMIKPDEPRNYIVTALMDKPQVDYDTQKALLFKLADQAIAPWANRTEEDLVSTVVGHRPQIASVIYAQMCEHYYCEPPKYEASKALPFVSIVDHNFEKIRTDEVVIFTETVEPTSDIPKKVFMGFKKSCHNLNKFDSKAEKEFAMLLERESIVQKWLRPASRQFEIWWDHNSKRYEPDFVVETIDTIWLVEIKARNEIDDKDVQDKAKAAQRYCEGATEFTKTTGGKAWKYAIVPHDAVRANASFGGVVGTKN